MAASTNPITDAQRSAAKVAGLAFPLSFFFVAYANFGIRDPIFVDGNMAETVRRVAEAQSLVRLSVLMDIAYCAGFVVLLSALYVVLKPVNRRLALLASLWKLMYVGSALLMAFTVLTVVHLAGDPTYAQSFGAGGTEAFVKLNFSWLWDEYYVGLVFWALSSTLFAWLWLKSRYIPSGLALAGISSSIWCVICAAAYLADPRFGNVVNVWLFDMPMVLFYIVLSGWLLIKGLRSPA